MPHPLDPLTADEVADAARRAKAAPGLSDRVRVVSVELREPDKADYLAWKAGGPPPPREAFCVLLDNGRRRGVEVVVPLGVEAAVSVTDLPEGVQPAMHYAEFDAVVDVVRADPRYLEALRRRGVDPSDVHVEPWSSGTFEPGPARQARAISWVRRDDDGDNPYSRPLYGLIAAIDLDEMRVLRVDDVSPGAEVPSGDGRRLPQRRWPPLPRRRPPDRDRPAAGPELHAHGEPCGLAAMGPARRVPPPRGPRAARHRLHGRG